MTNRFYKWALAASILFHLATFFGAGLLIHWHVVDLIPAEVDAAVEPEPEPLEFELVESPEDVLTAQPDLTHLLSDKTARARNSETEEYLPLGEAFSEGAFDFKELPSDRSQQALSGSESESDAGESAPEVEDQRKQTSQIRPAREFTRESITGEESRPVATVQPQTLRYKQQTTGTPEIGSFSFNTYAWDFAPYLLALRDKIQRNIFPPPAFTKMGIISGETIVRFRIYPGGEVSNVEVLDYRGHRSLMLTSVNAVKFAAPFRPLPEDFPEEYLEVTGRFSYIVMR